MTPDLRSHFLSQTAVLLLLLCMAAPAKGALIIYEGFNGYTRDLTDTPTSPEAPNASTIGLNKSAAYGALTSSYDITSSTSLTLSNLLTSGGMATTIAGGGNDVAGAQISLASGTDFTGTLWTSYLVNFGSKGTSTGDGFEVRLGGSATGSGSARIRMFGDSRSNSPNVGLDYTGGSSHVGAGTLTNGTTYIIIGQFTRVGEEGTVADPASGKLFALTAAQFNEMKGRPDAEAYLLGLTTADVGGALSGYSFRTITDGSIAATLPATGAFLQFVGVGDTVSFDEVRFGNTLADVTPVPEPSRALLMMAALCGMMMRRRRSAG